MIRKLTLAAVLAALAVPAAALACTETHQAAAPKQAEMLAQAGQPSAPDVVKTEQVAQVKADPTTAQAKPTLRKLKPRAKTLSAPKAAEPAK